MADLTKPFHMTILAISQGRTILAFTDNLDCVELPRRHFDFVGKTIKVWYKKEYLYTPQGMIEEYKISRQKPQKQSNKTIYLHDI